jgi:hypothetical protein
MADPLSPDASTQERRAHPREQVQVAVKAVFGKTNTALDGTIVDRSLKGMRLRLAAGQSVPNDFILLEPGTGQVHEVRSAWKAYPDVGLLVLRSYPIGAAGPQLQRIWRDATSR